MKLSGSIVLFLIFAAPLMARAVGSGVDGGVSSCKTVNFQNQLPPVRNQGEKNWCFAYAAADLASQKFKTPASATATADATYRNLDRIAGDRMRDKFDDALANAAPEDLARMQRFVREQVEASRNKKALPDREYGNVSESLAALKELGICLESDVPSTDGHLGMQLDAKNEKIRILRSEGGRRSAKNCNTNGRTGNSLASQMNSAQDIDQRAWQDAIDKKCKAYIPGDSFMPRSEELRGTWNGNGTVQASEKEKKRLLSTIDSALERGRISAITYNPRFLLPAGQEPLQGGPGLHASTIVGRECDNGCGHCKYLLRNSIGGDCSLYRAPYKSQCTDGHVWVSAQDLMNHMIKTDSLP